MKNKEIDEYRSQIQNCINNNQLTQAKENAIQSVELHGDQAIQNWRKHGLLRASNYDFKAGILRKICTSILNQQKKLSEETIVYINSNLALYNLALVNLTYLNNIQKFIQDHNSSILKTLLAIIDTVNYRSIREIKNDFLFKLQLVTLTPIEITEAISFIISKINYNAPPASQWLNGVETSWANNQQKYIDIIRKAHKIIQYKDAETLIDGLPYKAKKIKKEVKIISINPLFQKYYNYGYHLERQQYLTRTIDIKHDTNRNTSLMSITDQHYNDLEKYVIRENKPADRIICVLPTNIPFYQDYLASNQFFIENHIPLAALSCHYHTYKNGNVLDIKINEHVSALDIIKLQRFFLIINYMRYKTIDKLKSKIQNKEEYSLLFLNSTPVNFTKEKFIEVIHSLNIKNAEEVIKLCTLHLNKDYINLQYTPLLKIGNEYTFSPLQFGQSNLVRNIIYNQKLRNFQKDTNEDPMIDDIKIALENKGFKTTKDYTYGQYECDIIAWRDNALFIFECKNIYLPCSHHEFRTTYAHIQKAADQLTKRKEYFSNKKNLSGLFSKLNWDVKNTNNIYTCILLSNRMMNGWTENGHPVRQGYELLNILQEGKLNLMQYNNHNITRSLWKCKDFTTNDLIHYLSEQSLPNKIANIGELEKIKTSFDKYNLTFEHYEFNNNKIKLELLKLPKHQ